jgi:pyruvate dehydrogenase complex dehydrogenase (E1) component
MRRGLLAPASWSGNSCDEPLSETSGSPTCDSTDYINTIHPEQEPAGSPATRASSAASVPTCRWNAAIMVHRAQRPGIGVGGHISTYASSASLYEVGFNHFFRGKDHPGGGDQIFFQGHASPGIYARAFLEGRITERSRSTASARSTATSAAATVCRPTRTRA